ncbi:MAG: hypothetical protein AAF231_13875, partial [Pseudomonadota bacterium]
CLFAGTPKRHEAGGRALNLLRFAALSLTLALLCGQAAVAFPREGERCVQNQLAFLGHDPGPVDGFIGPQTRAAANAWLEKSKFSNLSALPDLTRTTALQWCREMGMHTFQVRQFWPSRDSVRVVPDAPLQGVKARLLEDVLGEVRRYFGGRYNIWLSGSYDVIAAENTNTISELLRDAHGERAFNFRFRNNDRICAKDGPIGIAYPNVIGICLRPSNAQVGPTEYTSKNRRTYYIVAHEFMHLIQFELSNFHNADLYFANDGKTKFGPEWLIEGGAMYFMSDFWNRYTKEDRSTLTKVRFEANATDLGLRDLRRHGSVESWAEYLVAHLAAHFLVQRFGAQSQFEYWRALGRLQDQDKAFRAVFGMSMDAFETEFETLRQHLPPTKVYGAIAKAKGSEKPGSGQTQNK